MKLVLTIFIVCFCYCGFSQDEPEFGPVNVSIEKYQDRPVLVFSKQGNQYFVNIRTDRGRVNYVLKYIGGKTQGGLTESTYSVYDVNGRKISALFRHTIGYNYGIKKQENSMVMLELLGKEAEQTRVVVHLTAL